MLAPLLAFFVLFALCQVQYICPDYANPMGWAFTSTRLPETVLYASPIVALIAVLFGYWARESITPNEA
jgi:hypothetical protein